MVSTSGGLNVVVDGVADSVFMILDLKTKTTTIDKQILRKASLNFFSPEKLTRVFLLEEVFKIPLSLDRKVIKLPADNLFPSLRHFCENP